jgi:hypothetical protein
LVERRKYSRLSIEMPVKCKILDRQKKNEISYEISSKTFNLSEGGACLNWPKTWTCKVCTNCLAWIYNHACILKEEPYLEESNKYLTTSTFIQVELTPPTAPEPIKVAAKITWVKPSDQENSYGIGLSFLKDEEGKLEELQEKISILKKEKSS